MYGSATPGMNKAVFDQIDAERQYRVLGIKQIGPTVGSAVGAVLITGFAGRFFWQSGFFVAVGIGLVTSGTFFILYCTASWAETTPPDFRGLLSNRTYVVLLPADVCIGAAFYTATGYTVLFIDESVGATGGAGGVVLAALQLASSGGRIAVGTLVDLLPGTPKRRTGTIFAIQAAVGGALFFALPLTDALLSAGAVFVGLGVSALGAGGMYFSCISTIVSEDELGAVSAAGQFAITVSGLFAPPTFSYLIDVSGYGAAWAFLGGLSFVAAGLAWVSGSCSILTRLVCRSNESVSDNEKIPPVDGS